MLWIERLLRPRQPPMDTKKLITDVLAAHERSELRHYTIGQQRRHAEKPARLAAMGFRPNTRFHEAPKLRERPCLQAKEGRVGRVFWSRSPLLSVAMAVPLLRAFAKI